MNIKPTGNRVLIEVVRKETKTSSGLFLPSNADEKTNRATVLAIGPDVEQIIVGDKVMFDKFAGIPMEDENQLIISQDDIIAILEDEKKKVSR